MASRIMAALFNFFILGAGDYYCSGNDLNNFKNVPPDGLAAMAEQSRHVLE